MEKYTVSDIKNAVKDAHCLADAVRLLGLRAAGGNFATVRDLIKKYDLDTAHFNPTLRRLRGLISYRENTACKYDAIFKKGSTVSSTVLKKYIKEHRLFPYICGCCGLHPLWNNKPLVLQLEHKNGIHSDNTLENLTWLCPNCHTQTSTYAGRARRPDSWVDGAKVKKPDRRKLGIATKGKYRFAREDAVKLYEEHQNYTRVGLLLGVSGNAIKKALRQL